MNKFFTAAQMGETRSMMIDQIDAIRANPNSTHEDVKGHYAVLDAITEEENRRRFNGTK
jgi:hypothetical protein